MTSILYFLPIIFLVIVVIFRFFWEGRDIRPTVRTGKIKLSARNIALLAIILPYVTAGIILYSGGRRPVIHFKLEGLTFSLQYKNKPRIITIGGSKENDIFIKDLPKDAFYVKKTEKGLLLDKGTGYDGSEIVRNSNQIAGLVPLKDGSKIEITGQGKNGKKTSNFGISQGGIAGLSVKLIYEGSAYKIPWRKSKIPFVNIWLPLFSLPNSYTQVFPLGKLMSGDNWQNGKGYKSSILFGNFDVENQKGEIFEPFLLVLDPGVAVDGKKIEPFPLEIKDGTSLSFLTLYGRTKPRLNTIMKIKEVKLHKDGVEFILDRPDTIAAKLEAKPGNERFVIGNIENLKEKIISFKTLSDNFSKYFAIFELDKEEIKVTGPFVNKKFGYHQDIEVGYEDKFTINIQRKGTPGHLIMILIFTGIVVVVFSMQLLRRLRYLILFGSIAILTTSRVLFAYTASTLPPFNNEAIPLSLFLLVFAPCLIVAVDSLVKVLECKEPDFLKHRKSYIINGIAALMCTLVLGIPQMKNLSSMLVIGAAAVVVTLIAVLVFMLMISSQRFKKLESKMEKYRKNFTNLLFKRSNRLLNVILIAFIIGRLLLLLTGNKESVNIGARFSISIITVPILIFFIGLCTSRFIGEMSAPGMKDKKVIYRYIGYTFGFSAVFFIFAFITSDLGQMIFALPVSMFLTAVMLWSYNKLPPVVRKHSLILAVPLVLIILFLMFPVTSLQIIEGVAERDMVVKEMFETDIVSKGQNVLRLMQYVAPKHLEEIGSISSESVAQHYAIMNAYTRRGLGGEGYMNVKVHPSLYRTCLNDNVSAVFIFSQFGVLGAITIIFVYGILIFIGYRSRQEIMEQEDQLRRLVSSISILAILVIVVVSLYMIGANCNLLLFTGRNLYLMGLNSMSDIFESSILLGIVVAGIAIGESSRQRRH